ncbi:hypothetical protein KCP77_00165 [Salmonella enterica subsp. enterica]|nr:hypothetical protein KCP77_00165 [Salmonella enterica subsp. enterica]
MARGHVRRRRSAFKADAANCAMGNPRSFNMTGQLRQLTGQASAWFAWGRR